MLMDDRTTIPLDAETKVAERPARPQDRVAAVAAAAHLHDADRERSAPPAARAIRRHAAALRSAGAARPRAERHDARRAVAAHDGVERQRHRPGRPAGRAGADRPPAVAERPPRRRSSASPPRAGAFFRTMARANADWIGEIFAGLSPTRHRGADAAAGQDQGLGAQGHRQRRRTHERCQSGHAAARRTTRPGMCGLRSTARSRRSRSTGPDRKNPLTFESYAEMRRPLPRRGARTRRQGLRRDRRRRQFLLRRRRVRDHRAADQDEHASSCSISPA